MKLALYLSLFLITLFTNINKSFSLTDYQIKKICKKERKQLTCIKNLKEKRSILNNGRPIQIPVIPYK